MTRLFWSASEGGAEQHADRRGREGWKILGVSPPPARVYSHADGLRVTLCVCGGDLQTRKLQENLPLESLLLDLNAGVWEYSIILVCRSSRAVPGWLGPFLGLSREAGLGSTL